MMFARLDDRAMLAVTGPDARPFLHNLLTQDVETLGVGEVRYGALLTPQGRVLHDLFLWGDEDGVRIDVAAAGAEDLLRRLTLYRLRAKVTIAATDLQVLAAWDTTAPVPPPQGGGGGPPKAVEGAAALEWRPDPRTPRLGWRALAPSTGSPVPAGGEESYERHRLALGVPDAHADGLHDRAYPLEADLDLLHAIDFKKGCFVGQETTSRMHRRGTLKTRLLPIAFDGPAPPPGSEVLAGDLRAGEVLSGVDGRALALLRLDRIAGPLTVLERPVRPDPPAWFPPL